MGLYRRFLRSKVARRIFLLFVACSLLPSIALSVISSRFVTRQLEAQQQAQLRHDAGMVGREILGRLALAESELRLMAVAGGSELRGFELDPHGSLGSALMAQFDGLVLLDRRGQLRQLIGPIGTIPRLDDSIRAHLEADGVHIDTVVANDGRLRVRLCKQLEGYDAGSVLIGQIRPEFLQELGRGIERPGDTELLILDAAGNVILSSTDEWQSVTKPLGRAIQQADTGTLRWEQDGAKQIGHARKLALGRYAAPDWNIAVITPRGKALASTAGFRRLLTYVSLICLGLVILLSFVQIRRSMIPLESLRLGTERIARREFEARVQLDTRDEFEQLATSFNTMAEDLGRQFNALATLAEIDHAILCSLDEQAIVRTVLDRIPDQFACQCVALTVFDAAQRDAARTYTRLDVREQNEIVESTWITDQGRQLLASTGERPIVVGRAEIPPHLARLTATGVTHCMLSSIRNKGELVGCLALGYQPAPSLCEDDFVDARRLTDQIAVALSNARLIDDMQRTNWETLHALARAVDANSPWTAGHSDRVTTMAVALAQRLGLSSEDVDIIQRGGWLHDIGKIGVSTEILDKQGPLLEEEILQLREHPVIGARILEPISAYAEVIPVVLYHHERYDGKGYPEGLAGEEIPLHARVLAIADVFDALISERPYRAGWELNEVVRYISEGAGTMFDPQMVPAFVDMIRREQFVDEGKGAETGFALMSA